MIATSNVSMFKGVMRKLLPGDKTFWHVYSPVIRILKDSNEHKIIQGKMNDMLCLSGRDTLLDAGCGRADWLISVSGRVGTSVGVDFENGMLSAARSLSFKSYMSGVGGQSRFTQASLDSMPFSNEYFTKIGSILVYGYLGDRDSARKELIRVLASGGRMAIVTPKKGARFFEVLKAEARARKSEGSILKNLAKLPLAATAVFFGKIAELKDWAGQWHFYEEGELERELEAEGLRIIGSEFVYAGQAVLVVAEKP